MVFAGQLYFITRNFLNLHLLRKHTGGGVWFMSEYEIRNALLNQEYLHNWRPPCSCGVSLDSIEFDEVTGYVPLEKEELHNWRPPCSCGISLDRIDLEGLLE